MEHTGASLEWFLLHAPDSVVLYWMDGKKKSAFASWKMKNLRIFSHYLLIQLRPLIYCVSRSFVSDSFAAPGTVALQAPWPMEFSRQEYWSGLPLPSPDSPSGWSLQYFLTPLTLSLTTWLDQWDGTECVPCPFSAWALKAIMWFCHEVRTPQRGAAPSAWISEGRRVAQSPSKPMNDKHATWAEPNCCCCQPQRFGDNLLLQSNLP